MGFLRKNELMPLVLPFKKKENKKAKTHNDEICIQYTYFFNTKE